MTVERRIVAGIDDIKSVSLECVQCKSRLTFSPDATQSFPESCGCGKQWRVPGALANNLRTADSVLLTFVESIPRVRQVFKEIPVGFKILFEFDEPK